MEIHRALDRSEASISTFRCGDEIMHQGSGIEGSYEYAFHVLKVLSFERKLAVGTNIVTQHGDRDEGQIVLLLRSDDPFTF